MGSFTPWPVSWGYCNLPQSAHQSRVQVCVKHICASCAGRPQSGPGPSLSCRQYRSSESSRFQVRVGRYGTRMRAPSPFPLATSSAKYIHMHPRMIPHAHTRTQVQEETGAVRALAHWQHTHRTFTPAASVARAQTPSTAAPAADSGGPGLSCHTEAEAGTRAPRRRPAGDRDPAGESCRELETPARAGGTSLRLAACLARAISGGHWQPDGGGEEPDWGAGATDGGPAANPAGIKLASGAGRGPFRL
jgi:hypothetical protein